MPTDDDASAKAAQEQSERLTEHARKWTKEFQANIGETLSEADEGHLEDCFRECVEEWIGEGRQHPRPEAIQEIMDAFGKAPR